MANVQELIDAYDAKHGDDVSTLLAAYDAKRPATAADRASSFGSGANEAIADFNPVSFLVDKATEGLNLIPGVDIENPVGGSQWVKEHLLPTRHEPKDQLGRYLEATGKGVGGALAGGLTMGSIGAAVPAARGLLGVVPRTAGGLLGELGLGAASGVGAEAGNEYGGPAGALAGGLLAPALLGGGVASVERALRGPRSAETAHLQYLSHKHNVPLSAGELRNSVSLKKGETALENMPFSGMPKFREKQGRALKGAAQKGVRQFKTGAEDPQAEIQQSLNTAYKQAQASSTKLYDAFRRSAERIDEPVSTDHLQSAAHEILRNESTLPAALRNRQGTGLAQDLAETSQMDISQLAKTRQRLNSMIRDARKGNVNGSVSNEQVAALQSLKKAIDRDLSDFAKQQGGDVLKEYQAANQYYADHVAPFKDRALRKLGSDEFDTDQLLTMFVKHDRPKLAAKLYNNLTPAGQQNVKYGVLQKAFDTAAQQGVRGGAEFSPAKFATQLEKLGDTKSVIFSPMERQQIEGLAKLARAAERGGQYAENPPTGNRVMQGGGLATLGYLVAYHPNIAVGAVVAGRGFQWLLTKPWAQKILARAAKTDSPSELNRLLGRLNGNISLTLPRKKGAMAMTALPAVAQPDSEQ